MSGVPIETIRYYEREGIVPKPARTPAGQRDYSEAGIATLRFIKRCRDLGFSIQESVRLRALAEEPTGTCETVGGLARSHLAEVRDRIDQLRRLEAALAELVSDCGDGRAECPVLRSLAKTRSE